MYTEKGKREKWETEEDLESNEIQG